MQIKEYSENLNVRKEIKYLNASIDEYFDLFLKATGLTFIEFYKYDYTYKNFTHEKTIGKRINHNETEISINDTFDIVLKTDGIVFGKLVVTRRLVFSDVLKSILKMIKEKFTLRHQKIKSITIDEPNLSIFIIDTDSSNGFAKRLQTDINLFFNANITITDNVYKVHDKLQDKETKNLLLYVSKDYTTIQKDEAILKSYNDYIIVFGPNDHNLSLLCGQLKIQHYIPIETYHQNDIKNLILSTKDILLNKFHAINNIISVSGISGGIGCTTIAMNMANILAKKIPQNNVLYIDLSNTKAISNLFLDRNPLPEKTILDLVNSDEFDINKNLDIGLVKVRENFYAINGIQKHIDKEYIEKDLFIEKFLNYLTKANEYFNVIIIDTGVFEASTLKTTIYDISNEIELITELNLPSVSKLKTLYSLMKRAGLKDKISFILNRYDSKNSLDNADALAILNITNEEENIFKYKISNDYMNLGKCWNNCELISNTGEETSLVHELINILEDKKILFGDKNKNKKKNGLFSFFNKG